MFAAYHSQYPDLAKQIDCMQLRGLPENWDSALPTFASDQKGIATRDSSGKVLNAIAGQRPWLLGGAADLAPLTKTELKDVFYGNFQAPRQDDNEGGNFGGPNVHFGVR